jgi:hypothetical protein
MPITHFFDRIDGYNVEASRAEKDNNGYPLRTRWESIFLQW